MKADYSGKRQQCVCAHACTRMRVLLVRATFDWRESCFWTSLGEGMGRGGRGGGGRWEDRESEEERIMRTQQRHAAVASEGQQARV